MIYNNLGGKEYFFSVGLNTASPFFQTTVAASSFTSHSRTTASLSEAWMLKSVFVNLKGNSFGQKKNVQVNSFHFIS